MSERRYGVHDCPNGYYYLRDVTDHSVYFHRNYGKLFSEYKEDIELVSSLLNELADKVDERQATINKLKEENERLKNKLNVTALELVDEAISMGKAVEISEMDYHEFLEYRQNKGKPMELQK